VPTDDGRRGARISEVDIKEVIGVDDPDAFDEGGHSPALTEEQIEEITTLLRGGRRLPPHLFPNLFEAPREYHLSYRGKARAVDILADTMAVPLQPVRSFGDQSNGWANMLVLGDNLQILRQLINLKQDGQLRNPDGTDGVRVCYVDPPFASQQEFVGGRNEKAYMDNVAGAEFVENLRRRLVLIHEVLTDDGSLFVHLDTRKAHYIKVVLDEIFGEGNFRNEIIWKRTSAHSGAKRFAPVHDVILFYSRSPRYKWRQSFVPLPQSTIDQWYNNIEADTDRRFNRADLTASGIRKGSSGASWRGVNPTTKGRHWAIPSFVGPLLRGLDTLDALDALDEAGRIFWPRRTDGMPMLKRYLDEAPGIPELDVITDVRPLNNVNAERVGYPTQKPIELVQRVVGATSDPGDIVLDAFVGSGTSLVAANTMEGPRRWIGIDSGKFAIYVTQARLLQTAARNAPDQAAFTLYNAGLYDYKALRELPLARYVDFVLELFQCRKAEETISGVLFHGRMGDSPVLVYDFEQHPDATIGQTFVEGLASICGKGLGDRCFIIAPASVVEPYEDYITIDDTRFFFLRIPYSVIAELHKKAFSDLRQPTSEAKTNTLIDAVGFDFIQPPRVECRYRAGEGDTLQIEITSFESEAFSARPTAEDITDLAMVLVDHSYDEEVFCLESVFFADDLERSNWKFTIPRAGISNRVMIIYVDLYGNEFREVKYVDEFEVATGRSKASSVKRANGRATQGNRSRGRTTKGATAGRTLKTSSRPATLKKSKSASKSTKKTRSAPAKAATKKAAVKAATEAKGTRKKTSAARKVRGR
jgi:site-specific DNA-methyltransferase (adenine-specific)/adenine-specific DNA-methyltransferase